MGLMIEEPVLAISGLLAIWQIWLGQLWRMISTFDAFWIPYQMIWWIASMTAIEYSALYPSKIITSSWNLIVIKPSSTQGIYWCFFAQRSQSSSYSVVVSTPDFESGIVGSKDTGCLCSEIPSRSMFCNFSHFWLSYLTSVFGSLWTVLVRFN